MEGEKKERKEERKWGGRARRIEGRRKRRKERESHSYLGHKKEIFTEEIPI